MEVPFLKMHGAGNDFVVFDARKTPLALTTKQVTQIADRRYGIGCDQLLLLEKSDHADTFMRIYNADGSESPACGNAERCVAWRLMEETGRKRVTVETRAGVLACEDEFEIDGTTYVRADIGEPRLEWNQIPLSEKRDTLHVGLEIGPLADPACVSMGNPHVVFFVPDADAVDIRALGPKIENHPLFPERVNVSVAQMIGGEHIKLKVWERGAGETLACGTAACATLVAANRRGLAGRNGKVFVPGGMLGVEWRDDNHVWLFGPVALTYSGTIDVL
jgi:diaminopimelate epimerase